MSISRDLEIFRGVGESVKKLLSSGAGLQGSESNVTALPDWWLTKMLQIPCLRRITGDGSTTQPAYYYPAAYFPNPWVFGRASISFIPCHAYLFSKPDTGTSTSGLLLLHGCLRNLKETGEIQRGIRLRSELNKVLQQIVADKRRTFFERTMQWGLKLQNPVDTSLPLLQDSQTKRRSTMRLL